MSTCVLAPNISSVSALLYENRVHSDVTFLVGPEKSPVKAHKLILAAKSDVMDRMLYGKLAESQQRTVSLLNTDPTAFEALLQYIYTGEVEVEVDRLPILVQICDYFNVIPLKKECLKWLYNHVDYSNVCKYLSFSEKFDASLHAKCQSILFAETDAVLGSKAFATDMEGEYVRLLVQNDAVRATEFQLFRGLLLWRNAQPDRNIDEFLCHIQFSLMTLDELQTVRASGAIDKETMDQVEAAFSFNQEQPFANLLVSARAKSRRCLGFDKKHSVGFELKQRETADNFWSEMELRFVQRAETLKYPTATLQISNETLSYFLYLQNVSLRIHAIQDSPKSCPIVAIGLLKTGDEKATKMMEIIIDTKHSQISCSNQSRETYEKSKNVDILLSAVHEGIVIRVLQAKSYHAWRVLTSFTVPLGNLRQSGESLQVIVYNSYPGITVSLGFAQLPSKK